VLAASIVITLMMEAASTSETSVNLYRTTQRNNPEDSHFQRYLLLLKEVPSTLIFIMESLLLILAEAD
jgi:hypothetical protein